MLEGRFLLPSRPLAAVILASVPALEDDLRDVQIAAELHRIGVATLYVPLLTEDEVQFDSRTTHFRYDADFLAQRFIEIAQWIQRNDATKGLAIGFAGSSGGAAGALVAAAQRPDLVQAVVSIDGRTDLAVDVLREVRTPVLLVVKDMPVLRMNREAVTKLRGERRIEIVHEAGIEAVVQKSVHWLADRLAMVPADAYGLV